MSIWVGPIISVKQHPPLIPNPKPVSEEKSQVFEKPDDNTVVIEEDITPRKKKEENITSKEEEVEEEEEPINEPEIKSIDYVITYDNTNLTNEAISKIETFIFNLEQKGFEIELTQFSVDHRIQFIKIHAPEKILLYYAELFEIELTYHMESSYFLVKPPKPFHFMATILTDPSMNHPLYERAKIPLTEASSPRGITNAEKSLIIYKVLSKNQFGEKQHDNGIEKLLSTNVFEAHFPLHDGPWQWTEEGPLNERQLLTKFWSNLYCFYKEQPLDMIHKYYGPETAFYFAWLGYYMQMLIPVSALGVVSFILGVLVFEDIFSARSQEVCTSNLMLCPRCHDKNCKFEALSNSCFHAHLIYLFDNPLVITFAGLMSIWSTFFVEFWRRHEALLQIRWNLRSVEADCSMRPQFEANAKHYKISRVTGNLEPYMPKRVMVVRYTITASVILLLIFLMILGIFGVMVYVKAVSTVLARSTHENIVTRNVGLIASSTGSIMSVCFILLFEMLYGKIATWLTDLENPRTQIDYDNSYTYKSYAMAFVNNYAVIFYIAFAKARFYTYPGDEYLWTTVGGIGSDLCDPAGCIVELGIQLVVVLLAKHLCYTGRQYLIPQMQLFLTYLKKHKKKDRKLILQWECDYLLNPFDKYHIMNEYMQMIIQYGFVTFFVAAFPPAPLLALINNLIELRVDALKITRAYRRPIAFKVANLAAWNGIIRGVTYIGVATNAFVIAFTSEFVQRNIYKSEVRNDLSGFVNTTLSAFRVSDFQIGLAFDSTNISTCFYPGKRYPPDHPLKYTLTDEHWYTLTIKFLAVVVFEHIVMVVTGIIAYVIPDIPFSVKEHINYQRDQFKLIKLKGLQGTYLKEQETKKNNIFKEV